MPFLENLVMGKEQIVSKILTLGGNSVEVKVCQTLPSEYTDYKIEHFVGKGNSKDSASDDFMDKVSCYARINNYNFIFIPSRIETRRVLSSRYGNPGFGPHICSGKALFMDEMPLEISKAEYRSFYQNLPVDFFLYILKERGALLKAKA